MLAVNNADEIKAVRTLYVCHISIVDQSKAQHSIPGNRSGQENNCYGYSLFVIGCRSFVLLLRNPMRNSKTANRQK